MLSLLHCRTGITRQFFIIENVLERNASNVFFARFRFTNNWEIYKFLLAVRCVVIDRLTLVLVTIAAGQWPSTTCRYEITSNRPAIAIKHFLFWDDDDSCVENERSPEFSANTKTEELRLKAIVERLPNPINEWNFGWINYYCMPLSISLFEKC